MKLLSVQRSSGCGLRESSTSNSVSIKNSTKNPAGGTSTFPLSAQSRQLNLTGSSDAVEIPLVQARQMSAVRQLQSIDLLRLKLQAKRNRFSASRAVSITLNSPVISAMELADGVQPFSVEETRKMTADVRRLHLSAADSYSFEGQEIDQPRISSYIASFVQRLFPSGMMVAALLVLLNTVVLVKLSAPHTGSSLDVIPMGMVVTAVSIYLIGGVVTKLTTTKRANSPVMQMTVSPWTKAGGASKQGAPV